MARSLLELLAEKDGCFSGFVSQLPTSESAMPDEPQQVPPLQPEASARTLLHVGLTQNLSWYTKLISTVAMQNN